MTHLVWLAATLFVGGVVIRHVFAADAEEGPEARRSPPPEAEPPPAPMSDAEVHALMEEVARPSIFLRRQWPLGTSASQSRFGGLPNLPEAMDWPRHTRAGHAIHFLAQLDCAELPTLDGASPLPREGLLLFFANLDEERLYDEQDDNYAVLYVPPGQQAPLRPAPDDLPVMDHNEGKAGTHSAHGQRVFAPWPVTAHATRTFPIEWHTSLRTGDKEYTHKVREVFMEELQALLPPPVEWSQRTSLATGRPRALDLSALGGGFPFCGEVATHLLRALDAVVTSRRMGGEQRKQWAKDNPEAIAKADQELEAARELGTQVDALRTLLADLDSLSPPSAEQIAHTATWLEEQPVQRSEQVVRRAVHETVRASVTRPELAALLPPELLEFCHGDLVPSVSHSEHMMLGAGQWKTNPTGGDGIRLLCLDSDRGMDFMFCDCGVIEFWIREEDLAAGRWDRAVAHTAGG